MMGDAKIHSDSTFSSLPPGSRFYPSDEQLVCYYLSSKNSGDQRLQFDVIKELDLYDHEPFNLPDAACFRFGRGGRKRHWYCYVARVLTARGRRRAGGGYWKRSGKVKDVVDGGAGKVVVGKRTSYVFYLGNSPRSAMRTDWIMHEYAPVDDHMASFVLCRVVVKSTCANNNVSEHALSSCGEESVATVRHIGIQHNEEANDKDSDSIDRKNKVLKFESGLLNDLDCRVNIGPLAGQMILSGQESLAAEQQICIMEEDFIELDDFLCPLPGIG